MGCEVGSQGHHRGTVVLSWWRCFWEVVCSNLWFFVCLMKNLHYFPGSVMQPPRPLVEWWCLFCAALYRGDMLVMIAVPLLLREAMAETCSFGSSCCLSLFRFPPRFRKAMAETCSLWKLFAAFHFATKGKMRSKGHAHEVHWLAQTKAKSVRTYLV